MCLVKNLQVNFVLSESDHETKVNKELKGVAEEDALRKLLTSDEDSEEEQEQKQESEQEDEPTKEGEERASKLTKKKKKADENKKGMFIQVIRRLIGDIILVYQKN